MPSGGFQLRRFMNPPSGATTNVTASLKTWGKKFLVTGTALTVLNGIPNGNAVALTQSLNTPIELSFGATYTTGDAVVGAPAAGWQSTPATAGSGWTTLPDAAGGDGGLGNETRTTAKPILAMMTVPGQRFTGKLKLYFSAGGASPLSKVRVEVEGTNLDLTSKVHDYYTDVNGVTRWFYGYVCELDAANYTGFGVDGTRVTRMFARAYSSDGTMQTQLIGSGTNYWDQYLFYPVSSANALHDVLVQVQPSAGSNSKPGGTYPSVSAIVTTLEEAIAYVTNNTVTGISSFGSQAKAPRIEVVETCSLSPKSKGYNAQTGSAWCTITHSAGVVATIGKTTFDTATTDLAGIPNYLWRPGIWGIEFRGSGIVFNNDNFLGFSLQSPRPYMWGNGIKSVFSWDQGTLVDNQGFNRLGVTAFPYQTDCIDLPNLATSCQMIRNNTRKGVGGGDFYDQTPAVFGDVTVGADNATFMTNQSAFSVTYSGAGTGSIVKSGANGNTGSTFKMQVNGVDVTAALALTLTTRISDVVTYINGQANWSATMLATPNDRVTDRHPSYLTDGNTPFGGFTKTLTTNVAYNAFTFIDIHADLKQFQSIFQSNQYMGFVRVFGATNLQTVFMDADSQDILFEEVFIDDVTGGTQAQYGKHAHSHVVIRNYSCPQQTFFIDDGSGFSVDSYCKLEGLVFGAFTWTTGSASPTLTNCHSVAAYSNSGSQVASNMSSGGSVATLYPNLASRDIAPGGLLLSNLASISGPDAQGAERVGSVPKGPKTSALASGTITKAQALQLAALTANDSTGTAVGTATLSWTNATGGTDHLIVSFDVAA